MSDRSTLFNACALWVEVPTRRHSSFDAASGSHTSRLTPGTLSNLLRIPPSLLLLGVAEEEGSDSLYCSSFELCSTSVAPSSSEKQATQTSSCKTGSAAAGTVPAPSAGGRNAGADGKGDSSGDRTGGAGGGGGWGIQGGDGGDGERVRVAAKDPITWFGVMVPPSLRDAQRSFRQGEGTEGGQGAWGGCSQPG